MKRTIIVLIVLFVSVAAHADNFGCTCLLCLAIPGGPTRYDECKPTIEKLYKMLWDGEPFPDCSEAEYSGMDVRKGVETHAPCVAGYAPAGNGAARVCRKIIGWEWTYERGGRVKVPVYQEYKPKRNRKPYYIEVYLDGRKQGERFWYKIKNKKSGWF